MQEVRHAVARRHGRARLPGVRRPPRRRRPRRPLHVPATSPSAARTAIAQPLHGRREDGELVGTAGHLHPGGLWTDLSLERGGKQRAAVPLEREVLRAGRRGVVGRRDGGDAGELARRRQGAATCSTVSAHLRLQARVLVRVDGDHGRSMFDAPAAAGRTRSSTNVDRAGVLTHGHLRREPQPRRRVRAGCPTRASCSAAPPRATHGRRSSNFVYGRGDLLRDGKRGRPPIDPPGPAR